MAKQKKTTKRKRTSAQKGKGNGVLNLIIVLFILLITSLVIAYFYINHYNKEKSTTTITQTHIVKNTVNKSENSNATKEPEIVEEEVNIFSDKTTLEGTWVSINSGAMLTISGHSYSIDFSSVETPTPIRGTFTLSDSRILFSSDDTDTVCGLTKGSYLVDFSDANIEFKAINDSCPKRKNTLESEWFRF